MITVYAYILGSSRDTSSSNFGTSTVSTQQLDFLDQTKASNTHAYVLLTT